MGRRVIMAGGGARSVAVVVGSGSWQRGLAVSVADLPVDRGYGARLRGPRQSRLARERALT
ncbi:hypothetical protein Afe04nite_73160 [Asanoa ferruginea]|nr:hypothetical protein Afe04nite_73160 [Asanoa ferruginea]